MDVEKHLVYLVNNNNSYADTYHLHAALQLSKVILEAGIQRKYCRGLHYCDDYPTQNKTFQKPYFIKKKNI